ncbi:mitochondrial inner membrane protein OXA1-like [Punica granatum]|uniref:Membrane insertase YidC/Oxa/ALB C-terminal domain-containing protein n=2 Tax=Punica granatum TaxID=22663 RepID=A0A218XK83_PUNGR|nr:mitochondrial inner membrane protein OXA1-like [Punica granatum]OWM85228.1 hypothetical protein CDL15_Pgr028015 [Punica granatum]PKI45326.1 hypothetical protein CRG98_034287 [Punica granatum]
MSGETQPFSPAKILSQYPQQLSRCFLGQKLLQLLFVANRRLLLLPYLSTADGKNADNVGLVTDILTNTNVQAVASHAATLNEVAIAAADSYFLVMCLQYVIDYVHQFSGLNWWASIVLTTLLIRGLTLLLVINQLKHSSKLAIIWPCMEEISNEMREKGMDSMAVAECQRKLQQLFKESGIGPFTVLKGMVIQGPVFISFLLAITNMAFNLSKIVKSLLAH